MRRSSGFLISSYISVMRAVLLLLMVFAFRVAEAQTPKINALPEFVYIPPARDKYVWERVAIDRGRTLFNNSVACTDNEVYSFGGFNTLIAKREMNRLVGKKLVKDSIQYPGAGFFSNVFFIRDSLMYIGGGHDSGMSNYSSTDFWRYDLGSHEWKRLKDLPFYYLHPPYVFSEKGRIIVLIARLQGKGFRESTPVLYEYAPDTDSWTSISKMLPASRVLSTTGAEAAGNSLRPVAFRVDDDIYVLFQNGCSLTGACSNTFYKYSLRNGEWTELPPFPGRAKMLNAAFALSDDTYGYIGGGRGGTMADNSKEVFRYDPQKDKWEQITDIPLGVRYAKGWRYKGERYVGFGINDKDQTVIVWKLSQKKR
jgi:hypothetical protein